MGAERTPRPMIGVNFLDKSSIKVYNYNGSFVSVAAKNRNIGFAGMQDGVPSMETLTFEEVEYINAHSRVFRVGRLEFEEGEREEIFAALKINSDNVLYERDIDGLISKWSEESAKRILSIADIDTLERVRGRMLYHQNRADMDIPTRMVTLVGSRFRELVQGRTKSRIVIADGPEPQREMVSVSEVKAMLENQRAELMAQFEAMMRGNDENALEAESKTLPAQDKQDKTDQGNHQDEPGQGKTSCTSAPKTPAKRGRSAKKDA